MDLNHLPNELIVSIFRACRSIDDVHALASTSRRFWNIFAGSQKLAILLDAAESQYGPLHDAVQIVTYNASQPASLARNAPVSMALLKQLVAIGITATKWTEYYPAKKWKLDFEDRRLLTSTELRNVRRAIYRLWLYCKAFHNSRYPRTTRNIRQNVLERAELLHNWSTLELAEIEDVREVVRDVVQRSVCPSNGAIQTKFRKRFPDSDQQLQFNIHLNYPPPPSTSQNHFYSIHQLTPASTAAAANLRYKSTAWHEVGSEGWGDDIPHYYVVEDMLKLDPAQILWLKENAPLKPMVESYVRSLGEWFENNGETFGQTLEWVLNERGEEAVEIREAISDRELGIVCSYGHPRGRVCEGEAEGSLAPPDQAWLRTPKLVLLSVREAPSHTAAVTTPPQGFLAGNIYFKRRQTPSSRRIQPDSTSAVRFRQLEACERVSRRALLRNMEPPKSPNQEGPSEPPPQLPEGWLAQWDASSRKYYYVQRATGHSQWEVPTQPALSVPTPEPTPQAETPFNRPPENPPSQPAQHSQEGEYQGGERGLVGNLAMQALGGGKKPGKQSGGIGGLASSLLSGGHGGQSGSQGSSSGKIAGQLIGSFLGGGKHSNTQNQSQQHSQQHSQQQWGGSTHGASQGGYGQSQPSQQGHHGGLAGAAAGYFGGHHQQQNTNYGYSSTGQGQNYSGTAPPATYQAPQGHYQPPPGQYPQGQYQQGQNPQGQYPQQHHQQTPTSPPHQYQAQNAAQPGYGPNQGTSPYPQGHQQQQQYPPPPGQGQQNYPPPPQQQHGMNQYPPPPGQTPQHYPPPPSGGPPAGHDQHQQGYPPSQQQHQHFPGPPGGGPPGPGPYEMSGTSPAPPPMGTHPSNQGQPPQQHAYGQGAYPGKPAYGNSPNPGQESYGQPSAPPSHQVPPTQGGYGQGPPPPSWRT